MQSKVRLFGHAVHPMLVDFPIVTFVVLAVMDVGAAMGKLELGQIPIFLVGFGGATAILAILTGVIDYVFIPKGTRARKLATWHLTGGIVVWLWFGASSWAHVGGRVSTMAYVDLAGVLIVIVQSYVGAELLERHHIGVRSEAEGAEPVRMGGSTGR